MSQNEKYLNIPKYHFIYLNGDGWTREFTGTEHQFDRHRCKEDCATVVSKTLIVDAEQG